MQEPSVRYQDFFEDYYYDRLDHDDRKKVIDALEDDIYLLLEYEEYALTQPIIMPPGEEPTEVEVALRQQELENIRNIRRNFLRSLELRNQPVPNHGRQILIFLAVIAVLGGLQYLRDLPLSGKQLFRKYYAQPYLASSETMSTSDQSYLLAHEKLAQRKPAEARALLASIQQPSQNRADEIEWFTVLSYLQENNLGEAQKLLRPIVDEAHLYFYKTRHLYREIQIR